MEAPFLLSLIFALRLTFLPGTLADVTVRLKQGMVSWAIGVCVRMCWGGGGLQIPRQFP